MSVATDYLAPVERLIERFDLETLDPDLFLGDPGPGARRLFGGLVAATPEELPIHLGGHWGLVPDDRNPIEMRSPDGLRVEGEPLARERIVWMSPRGPVPDDPLIHTALLVYASDRNLVSTAVRPLDEPRGGFQMASLDHALWVHRPVRFDDWLLFVSESPVAHSARGLIFGSVFHRDGTRLASVAQEGLVRLRRDAP